MAGRNPVEVIDTVLAKLPEGYPALRARLEKIKSNSRYRAPELEGQRDTWIEVGNALNENLPFPPKEDWQKDIFRIITGKEPPEEKAGP